MPRRRPDGRTDYPVLVTILVVLLIGLVAVVWAGDRTQAYHDRTAATTAP